MRLWGYEVRFAQICRYPHIYHLKTYKRSDLKTSKPNETGACESWDIYFYGGEEYEETLAAIEYKANLWGMVGLQGQKISAQGNTLGNCNRQVVDTPYRGKRVNKFIMLLPFP